MSWFMKVADNTLSAGTSELARVNPLSQVGTLRQLILVAGHARRNHISGAAVRWRPPPPPVETKMDSLEFAWLINLG